MAANTDKIKLFKKKVCLIVKFCVHLMCYAQPEIVTENIIICSLNLVSVKLTENGLANTATEINNKLGWHEMDNGNGVSEK